MIEAKPDTIEYLHCLDFSQFDYLPYSKSISYLCSNNILVRATIELQRKNLWINISCKNRIDHSENFAPLLPPGKKSDLYQFASHPNPFPPPQLGFRQQWLWWWGGLQSLSGCVCIASPFWTWYFQNIQNTPATSWYSSFSGCWPMVGSQQKTLMDHILAKMDIAGRTRQLLGSRLR